MSDAAAFLDDKAPAAASDFLDSKSAGDFLDEKPAATDFLASHPAITPEMVDKLLNDAAVVPLGLKAVDAQNARNAEAKGFSVLKSDQQIMQDRIRNAQLTDDEMQALGLPKWTAPVERGLVAGVGGLADPQNILYAGAPGEAGGIVGKAFMMQMGTSAATETGAGVNDLAQGRTSEGVEKIAGAIPGAILVGAGVRSDMRAAAARETGMPSAPPAEPTKAADGTISEFGGEQAAPAPSAAAPPQETPAEAPPEPAAPQAAPTPTQVATPNGAAAAPVQRIDADQITTRPDLMQFKRMDDTDSGVNEGDKLAGKWDDLKAGNLLLWEPKDPAAYGLEDGEKYIVANGHHRFEFGERQDVPAYNAQIVREAEGYSAQDARSLAAEVNIADGKGTIYDQVKFLRNESATHGTDEALARAGRIGVKGRQASTIAFQAGPDLYTSFVNEQVRPEQAETIAKAAPVNTDTRSASAATPEASGQNEGLQRLGIRKAIDGSSPAELSNLIQAVRLEGRNLPTQQFDLFAADDSALQTAEQLASVASRIQGEIGREIRSTDAAAKNATTAKAKGIQFEKSPQEILADNAKLKAERDRWDNWALHPDLVQQVRDYAEMKKSGIAAQMDVGQPPRNSANKLLLQSYAEQWQKQLPGAPKVEIVQHPGELPSHLAKHVQDALARGHVISGLHDVDGKSYVIADHIPDEAHGRETWFHELLGHGRMEKLLKPGDFDVLEKMINRARPRELARIAKLYELDLKTEEGRRTAIIEYVARAASLLPERDSLWGGIKDRLFGALARVPLLRNWLAAPGLDARMRALARQGAASYRRGEVPGEGSQNTGTHRQPLQSLRLSLEQDRPEEAAVKGVAPEYRETVYRGTGPKTFKNIFAAGTHFTTSESYAEGYARTKGGVVISGEAQLRNPYIASKKDFWKTFHGLTPEQITKRLIEQGHDGVVIKHEDNVAEERAAGVPERLLSPPYGKEIILFDPAKFDKSESGSKLREDAGDLSNTQEADRQVQGRQLDRTPAERGDVVPGAELPEETAGADRQPAALPDSAQGQVADLQRRIALVRGELNQPYTTHPELRRRLQSDLDDLLVQYERQRNSANAFVDALRNNPEWMALARDREQGKAFDRNRMAQIEQQTRATLANPTRSLEQRLDALKRTPQQIRDFLAPGTTGPLFEGVTILPIEVWNGSIEAIKLAVRAGKTLAQGIEDGIAWLKKNYPAVGFDEQEYRDAVNEQYGMRQFGEKLRADPNVPEGTKAATSEWVYRKLTDADALTEARTLIQKQGMDSAVQAYKHADMPEGIRSALGKELIKQYSDQSLAARRRGDTMQAEAIEAKQADLIDFDLKRSTDVAQAMQKMSLYGDMSPHGILKHAQRVIQDAGDREMRRLQPVTELIRNGFKKANDVAVNETVRDPAVNGAAREAVNEHIEDSPETHRGVVMEVTGAFAQSPEILRQARELVRENVQKLLKPPGGAPLAPRTRAEFSAMLDDLSKRIAGIAASHYQGAELGKTLAKKIQERTGLSEDTAKRVAAQMDKVFASMVKKAQEKIPWRIAMQRAKQVAPFDPNEVNQPAVDRAIRGQLRDLNLKLGELVKKHSSVVDNTGKSIADRIVTDAGLTGPAADNLRAVFDKRFNELATAAKRTEVQKLLNAGNKIPPRIKNAVGDLIKWTNTGAFDDAKFYDAIRKRLDLPKVTPELARELVKRANDLQTLPEGFQRDRASIRLLDYVASQKPLKLWELPMGIWYANVLSGLSTHTHIMLDNIGQLAGNALVNLVRRPQAIPGMVKALGSGLGKGTLQAGEIMKTGIVTGIKDNLHTSQTLERNPFKGPLSFLNNWKYVGRSIAATHVLLFKPAMEMKQALIARDVAKREGLTGDAFKQRVADIMANTEDRVNAARAQATAEGLTGLDLKRRTSEIIEQRREQAAPGITENSRQYALRSTYLQDPYGIAGYTAQKMGEYFRGLEQRNPVFGPLARITTMPFMRIAGNILDEKLNWTPVGALRASKASRSGELYGKPITDPSAIGDLYTKAILGTVATVALASSGAVTGSGPASPAARKQLMETGWRPHSVKIGNLYVSYLRTPAALPLAVIGNYMDAQKYKHLDNADALGRAAYAWGATTDAVLSQSYLDTLGNLFEAAKNENPAAAGQKWEQIAARMGSKFVVPNLLMQTDRLFDPTVYDDKDVKSLVRAQIPFVRRMNQPVLNVLGDPIQRGIFDRDIDQVKPDPLWQVLAEKQAWVPEANRNVIVGDKRMDNYRALTPDEFYQYTKESGLQIRERLNDEIDDIKTMEPDEARERVRQITHEERKAALEKFQ